MAERSKRELLVAGREGRFNVPNLSGGRHVYCRRRGMFAVEDVEIS